MPGVWTNVSGVQRQGLLWHKVSGTWQRVAAYTKVSGDWRLFSGGSVEYVGKVEDSTNPYATDAPDTVGAIPGDMAIATCASGTAPTKAGASVWTQLGSQSVFWCIMDALDVASGMSSTSELAVVVYRGARTISALRVSFSDATPKPVAGFSKNAQYAGLLGISRFPNGSGGTIQTGGVNFSGRSTIGAATEYTVQDYLAPNVQYPDNGTFTSLDGTPPIGYNIYEFIT